MATNSDSRCRPAVRTVQRGSFELPLAPAVAFDLFTAEGERRWVRGWDPLILSACMGSKPGAVFITGHGGEQTIWTVIESDRDAGRLLYSRVSPGRRAGTVGVEITPSNDGSTITVSYDLTMLGPEGEAAVLEMDKSGFAAMLAEWRRLIFAVLD